MKIRFSKKLFTIIAYLFVTTMFFGCKDDPKQEPAPDKDGMVRLELDYLDFTAEGSEDEIGLKAETDWKVVTASDSWLEVSPTEGKSSQSQTLLVSVDKNEGNGERKAQIIVKALSGSSADTLTIRQAGISRYVDIDWENEAKLTQFDLKSGNIKIDFDGKAPVFTPEVSAIVVPTDTMSYIRVIKSAMTNGKSVTLQTVEGNMTDIFMNQEFTLSTVPASKTYTTRSGVVQTTDEKGVFHPQRITMIMEDGHQEVLYDVRKGIGTRATSDETIKTELFYWKDDRTGEILYDVGGVTIQWDKCLFETAIDGKFYFNFGADVKSLPDGIMKVPIGKLEGFFYTLTGRINCDYLLHLIAQTKRHYETKQPVILNNHVFGTKGLSFVFSPFGVPVKITIDPSFKAEFSANMESRCDFLTGFNAGLTLEAGVNWYPGYEQPQPIGNEPEKHFKPYCELRVKGNAEASMTIYPDVRIRLYDFAGFNIQFKPTLGDEFKYGGIAGGDDENYAAWTNRIYQRLSITGNVALDFIGDPWRSDPLDLYNGSQIDLLRAPEEIHFILPENHTKVNIDETITAEVEVKDYRFGGEKMPVGYAFVKFEAVKGEVDAKHAITDEKGRAKVKYTPKEKGSSLIARIVDADGKDISSAVFTPEVEQTEERIWIVDEFEITIGGIDGASANGKWRNIVKFRTDGTYSYIENPTRKTLEWVSLGSENVLSIYRYCNGTYQYDAEKKMLTLEGGPIVNESLLNGKPYTTLGYNSMYDIFGKSSTREANLEEDGKLAIQNGDHFLNLTPISSYDELKQLSGKASGKNSLPKRTEKIIVDVSGQVVRNE